MHSETVSPRRLLALWFWGFVVATHITWVAARPLVDSILVRSWNPELEHTTLQPGQTVHWRSEGWGTTKIGDYGLPGFSPRDARQPQPTVIALWGDSQVEGLCVDDAQKIHTQVEELAERNQGLSLQVLPCGRSGTDARDWIARTPNIERQFQPDLHVWLVTEIDDLEAVLRDTPPEPSRAMSPWVSRLSAWHTEAFVAAGRNLVLDRATGQRRRLDWRLIPRSSPSPIIYPPPKSDEELLELMQPVASRISEHAAGLNKPLVIVYAPAVPFLSSVVNETDLLAPKFSAFEASVASSQLTILDLRPALIDYYHSTGQLPRGFNNGFPGLGHLNVAGNQIVAQAIVDWAIIDWVATR